MPSQDEYKLNFNPTVEEMQNNTNVDNFENGKIYKIHHKNKSPLIKTD